MYKSNSTELGSTSVPRIEQFSESASITNRVFSRAMTGCCFSINPVDAEPVKPTTSSYVIWSSKSPVLPQTSCKAPVGRMFDSIIWRTINSVRNAVWLPGFTIDGTPATIAGANFSSIPQHGKLNAFICTATPCNGVYIC